MRFQLNNGADVNTHDKYGKTVLRKASECGHLAVMTPLLENGANDNAQDEYGQTALQMALKGGHEAIVELLGLLENSVEVNTCNQYRQTALQTACNTGDEAVVRLLLESGTYAPTPAGWRCGRHLTAAAILS